MCALDHLVFHVCPHFWPLKWLSFAPFLLRAAADLDLEQNEDLLLVLVLLLELVQRFVFVLRVLLIILVIFLVIVLQLEFALLVLLLQLLLLVAHVHFQGHDKHSSMSPQKSLESLQKPVLLARNCSYRKSSKVEKEGKVVSIFNGFLVEFVQKISETFCMNDCYIVLKSEA